MMSTIFHRQAFEQSRLLEFFTEKELTLQIGTTQQHWPIALLKELIDNGLDACETAGTDPVIEVEASENQFSVADNGPGIPASIIARSLDYGIRVSTNSAYVAPTRGQLGNALKCVWAGPFVADGRHGHIEVETHGECHTIDVRLDQIRQEPVISRTITESSVKTGTKITLYWQNSACLLSDSETGDFYRTHRLVSHFASINPHATFVFNGEARERTGEVAKWLPSDPTSPHWYTPAQLRDLIARHVAQVDEWSVRDFVAQFRGLSGTAKRKRVVDHSGLSGATLQSLERDGEINLVAVNRLLSAMQEQSIPVKPGKLGSVGEDHVRQWMGDLIVPESFAYKRLTLESPAHVVEAAFGIFRDQTKNREIFSGANFTPLFGNPFSRVEYYLSNNRVDAYDRCLLWLHVISPTINFTDRGKSRAELPSQVPLEKAIAAVCKIWKRAKADADREGRIRERHMEALWKWKQRKQLTIKQAAYRVMEQAYIKVSDNGRLPANARQIMYAARGGILRLTGKDKLDDQYFTQTLLPDFMDENPELTASWDVAYDDRGNFVEPHTQRKVPLGTLNVRRYIRDWHKPHVGSGPPALADDLLVKTSGPDGRYRFALFIEKEGFNALLEQSGIAQKWDIAPFSTKGMSVIAARRLVEHLSEHGVTILVAHDFDKSGFDIHAKLFTDTRRYRFKTTPNVVDIGLRLEDIENMGLESEPVIYETEKDPREILREQGASEAEVAMLVSSGRPRYWQGQRVELNAMTSQQFLDWLERKLKASGVGKVVPDPEILREAFKRARYIAKVEEVFQEVEEDDCDEIPDDLEDRIKANIEGTEGSWEDALREVALSSSTTVGEDDLQF